ncbi:MAG: hypothetical protein GY765_30120, partial [bacterium]|nr:hypothetical protein [bacterium]
GVEVVIGSTSPEDVWEKRIENALKDGNWLVQEYVEPYHLLAQRGARGCVPHSVIWGTFVFGDRFGGTAQRVQDISNDKIINSAQGARSTIAFEVDD